MKKIKAISNTKKVSHKLSLKTIVLIIVSVIMAGIVLSSIGKPILSPWPLSAQPNFPNEISIVDNDIAICTDHNSKRLLTFNSNKEIEQCINIDPQNNNGKEYCSVLATTNCLYYAVASSDPDTTYLSNEKVYRCDRSGNNTQIIYERAYNEDEHFLKPTFINLSSIKNDVILTCVSKDKSNIQIISLSSSPGEIINQIKLPGFTESISSASYSQDLCSCAIISESGNLFISKNNNSFEYIPIDNMPVLNDCAWAYDGNLYSVSPFLGTLIKVDVDNKTSYSYNTDKKYNSVCEQNNGTKLLCGTVNGADLYEIDSINAVSENTKSIEPLLSLSGSTNYSPLLSFKTIIVWVAIAYTALLIIVLIAKLIIRQIKKKNYNALGKASLIIVSIIALCGLSIFYSAKIYDISLNKRQSTIDSICANTENLYNYAYSFSSSTDSIIIQDSYQKKMMYVASTLSDAQKSICQSFADNNLTIKIDAIIWNNEASLFAKTDADGASYKRFFVEDAKRELDFYKTINNKLDDDGLNKNNDQVVDYLLNNVYPDSIISCNKLDTPYQDINGLLIVSSSIADLGNTTTQLNNEIAMSLIITFGLLILVFLEGKSLIDTILRKRHKKNKFSKEIEHTRQFNFLMAMATGFDCTICILISKDILTANNMATNDAVVSFPVMASSLGVFIGIIIFGFLSKKSSGRKIFLVGCVMSTIFTVGEFYAVLNNLFWAFVVFKLLASVSIYIPSAMVNIFPYMVKKEEDKAKFLQDLTMTGISGVAIGNVICGYCAENMSNASIYLANILPIIIAIIMGIKIIPKGKYYYKNSFKTKKDKANKKFNTRALKMFLSPSMLSLCIFIILPLAIAAGYKSILFPLYGEAEGMSKSVINNIVVVSNILVFIISPSLTKLFDKVDQKTAVIICQLLTGVFFFWFIMNDTMIWALLTLITSAFLYKISIPGQQILTSRAASYYNVEQTVAGNIESLEANFACVIRSPILSSLTAFGMDAACIIVGAITGAGAVLFALVTNKNKSNPFAANNESNLKSQNET